MTKQYSNEFLQFMKENMHLLDEYRFEEIYSKGYNSTTISSISEICSAITESMLSLGINPLYYMSYIPCFFLYTSDVKEIHIPDTIKLIDNNAITKMPNITKLVIPASVQKIRYAAFEENHALTDVYFLGKDTVSDEGAFQYCWQDIKMHINHENKYLIELAHEVWESEVEEI